MSCKHVYSYQSQYGIMRCWETHINLNRVLIYICNNCPTMKIQYQFASGKTETIIIDPPVSNEETI